MSNEKTATRIDGECLALGRYLFGQDVSEYVRDKYGAASAVLGLEKDNGSFDRLLVSLAVRHPLLARPCDAYARFFAPQGALRKKMVVLLAIAEVTPPTFRALDVADSGGRFLFFVRTMRKGAGMVLSLLPALIVLLPLQLALKLTGRPGGKGEAHV
jgi:hypothetical protein